MARITSEEDYERRRALLERHKDEESRRIGRDLLGGAVSGIADATGSGKAVCKDLSKVFRKDSK